MEKPVIYQGKTEKDLLACCPNCEADIDWTFETVVLGSNVAKWIFGKRKRCLRCGTIIDWSDYIGEVII